jgi:hypothetical protein
MLERGKHRMITLSPINLVAPTVSTTTVRAYILRKMKGRKSVFLILAYRFLSVYLDARMVDCKCQYSDGDVRLVRRNARYLAYWKLHTSIKMPN